MLFPKLEVSSPHPHLARDAILHPTRRSWQKKLNRKICICMDWDIKKIVLWNWKREKLFGFGKVQGDYLSFIDQYLKIDPLK